MSIAKLTRKITLLSLLLITQLCMGMPISIKAKLDSATMLMGNINMMRVEVVQDKGAKGHFPLLRDAVTKGYASVCGDSIELRLPIKQDTTELGSGRIKIMIDIPVQSFDSGYYHLPKIAFAAGKDTAYTEQLSLRVVPVKATANDEISPLSGVAQPEDSSWTDMIPDFLYYWWWLILLCISLIILLWWAYKKYGKKNDFVVYKKKEIPKPWIVALKQLQDLKARKLWESGREKDYFTELTDILRQYLFDRYGINANEMTSREIMDKLRENQYIKDKREYMRQILDMADFVKFAKVRPLPDDNTKAFENAVKFVELTTPIETTDPVADNNIKTEEK